MWSSGTDGITGRNACRRNEGRIKRPTYVGELSPGQVVWSFRPARLQKWGGGRGFFATAAFALEPIMMHAKLVLSYVLCIIEIRSNCRGKPSKGRKEVLLMFFSFIQRMSSSRRVVKVAISVEILSFVYDLTFFGRNFRSKNEVLFRL